MIQLRPYQFDAINQMRSAMRDGFKSLLYTAPTGSGKTLLTAFMLKTCMERGQRAFFIVHRRELIKQSIEAFRAMDLVFGVISSGWNESPSESIQIASIQSLIRRHQRYAKPNLIVWDESHHVGARSWAQLHAQYPGAYHIGLTATPCRFDGRSLVPWFNQLILGPSTAELIKQGFLSPYRIYVPSHISMNGVPRIAGDYDRRCTEGLMDKPTITGNAIQHYRRLALDKRAIVFAVSIQHSKNIVAQFLEAGIPAEHVDGENSMEARDAAIHRFVTADTKVLSNVDLFGEGFDVPSVEAIIGLRPTQSCGLYLQQVGRGLRPSVSKSHCIILDHAGNVLRHGLPDENREWSLERGIESKRENNVAQGGVKICPSCFAAQLPCVTCQFCGFVFEIKAREVKEIDGELQEVTAIQRQKEQSNAHDLESLYRLGVSRGYRYARRWAHHVWQARQRAKLGAVA